MKTLSDVGEFGLINKLIAKYSAEEKGVLGLGDDCAVISINSKQSRLVTTDLLIENVHFLKDKITPFTLGYKSLAVNFSDIAAMGGYPQEIYISAGFPENLPLDWIYEFYNGIHQLAEKYDARLMGGDTTKSPKAIVINILVNGLINTENIKLRSQAQIGDAICLNHTIGDSAAGLRILLDDMDINSDIKPLVTAHNHPEAKIYEGKWLGKHKDVHAMLDVSDGIGSDLMRLIERSKVGMQIDLDKLPLSDELQKAAHKYGWDLFDLAVNGGEDYCLLFTVANNKLAEVKSNYEQKFQTALFSIGRVKEKSYGLQFVRKGQELDMVGAGFDHFRKNKQ